MNLTSAEATAVGIGGPALTDDVAAAAAGSPL